MTLITRALARRWIAGQLAALLGCATSALAGANSVETEVGANVVATSDDSPLLDCAPFTYDKQGLLALRDVYAERDQTYTTGVIGRAHLTEQKNLAPTEATGAIGAQWRSGRHSYKLGTSLSYTTSDTWGCSTTVAEQLQRRRDLQNKLLVPGQSLHTRTIDASYAYQLDGDQYELAFNNKTRTADKKDVASVADASWIHSSSKTLKLQGIVGGGVHTGTFDPETFTHAGVSAAYQPSRSDKISLKEDTEHRNTGEQRLKIEAGLDHKTSPIVSEQLSTSIQRLIHSQISSSAEAHATATAAFRQWTHTIGAHRQQIDDARHSSSNWYTIATAHALTRQQVLGAHASYGSQQPAEMRMMSSAGVNYALQAGSPGAQKGRTTASCSWTAAYTATRLVSLTGVTNTVRQIQAGVLGTF